MPYVEGQTVHDADAHVMELPGTLEQYIEPAYREALKAEWRRAKRDDSWVPEAKALQADPEFRAAAPENLWLRKNYQAMGAFDAADRPAALDLFGFASQLVFTTAGLSLFDLEHGDDPELAIAAARAHNRMHAEFCSVDKRLLATGYVPLVDRARAVDIAQEAIDLRGFPSITRPATSTSNRCGRWPRRRSCRSCSTSAARRRWIRPISKTGCRACSTSMAGPRTSLRSVS
jgi:hypothetical protein